MDDTTGDRADKPAVGQFGDLDAAVILHLGNGRVDHSGQRHRRTLVAGELRTGEHQQVGAVAAQPRGQMIQPEQAVQALGVLFVALQAIDE
ncbi:hypothetical protein MYSI104531_16830 [Mycobacterium simiae]